MDFRIIKSPTEGTLDIIKQRVPKKGIDFSSVGAIGLIQGKFIEMLCAADIAEKAVGVTVSDIRGNCPQHMVLLAVFGDTSAVEAAIQEVKFKLQEGKKV